MIGQYGRLQSSQPPLSPACTGPERKEHEAVRQRSLSATQRHSQASAGVRKTEEKTLRKGGGERERERDREYLCCPCDWIQLDKKTVLMISTDLCTRHTEHLAV